MQETSHFRVLLGTLRTFLTAFIGSYALSVALFLLGRFIVGERWVLIAFFNTFAHLLWLPALVLLPLALLLRLRWVSAMLVLPVLAFILTYGGQFVPRDTTLAGDESVSILSMNLMALNNNSSAVIERILEVDADIVVLQELNFGNASELEFTLGSEYPHIALHPNQNPFQGQGILSRYPITSDVFWQYDWLPIKLGHQRAVLTLPDDRSLTLYNVHPMHPGLNEQFFNPRYRQCEIKHIVAESLNAAGRVIIVGDFNMPDLSDDYAIIDRYYTDAYREAGWGMGWTFPANHRLAPPLLRLDYLWYSTGFSATSSEVLAPLAGSDHLPLLTILNLQPMGEPNTFSAPSLACAEALVSE